MAQFWAIITAVKEFAALFRFIYKAWEKFQDSRIDKHYDKKQKRLERLSTQIDFESRKESPNDQTLKDLHRKLRNIKPN